MWVLISKYETIHQFGMGSGHSIDRSSHLTVGLENICNFLQWALVYKIAVNDAVFLCVT